MSTCRHYHGEDIGKALIEIWIILLVHTDIANQVRLVLTLCRSGTHFEDIKSFRKLLRTDFSDIRALTFWTRLEIAYQNWSKHQPMNAFSFRTRPQAS